MKASANGSVAYTRFDGLHMNARNSLVAPMALAAHPELEGAEDVKLLEYWDIIVDNRWLIVVTTLIALAIGVGYAFLSQPIYESNLLIQVEESPGSAKNLFGDVAGFFDIKTPAAAEMEIIRSRMVIGKAVDQAKLYIDARPHYVPIIGNWLARHAHSLSNPGLLGFGGYVSGTESIAVSSFEVPFPLEESRFVLTAAGGGRFTLSHPQLTHEVAGSVGTTLVANTEAGPISLLVKELNAKPGAEFYLNRSSRLKTIEQLQDSLKLVEKGRQSGVIEASLLSKNPRQLSLILNQIGHEYVHQNIERKAAEAEKMLAFVDVQLPQFKKQLDQAEQAYSQYRNQKGTIALDEEAKAVLGQEVDLQSKLVDAQQKRLELVSRFTNQHPAVKTLDEQIVAWHRQIDELHARVRTMPTVQQDAIRLARDVSVSNDAYQSLRNNALQLQLMREGKVGNVRLIDEAAVPEEPVQPKRQLAMTAALVAGLMSGLLIAFARNAFFRAIRSPQEIEAQLGVSVYSTIPLSQSQTALAQKAAERQPGIHLLAAVVPDDPAVESLRSLRTALQFAMLETENNRVLITGATPGVGKSFVSANFAIILASAGKRVLLVDADLRKGHLNHYFGISRERGLSELVAGTVTVTQAIHKDVFPNLDLVTTGVLPPNPAELMMSAGLGHVLNQLSGLYDIVIMDTAPVLVAADAIGASGHAGTVLLVARAGQSQIGELHEAARRLAHAGRSVGGVLFNAMDFTRRHYGSYSYKYGGYKYRQYSYERATK
jgi:tyrosine-protein kinase Etk/Wzc